MINPHQFINLILEPSLRAIGMHSVDAMHLMTCTFLVESKLTHFKQLPSGPALGFGQMEWLTYLDCCRYLEGRDDIKAKVLAYCERGRLPINPSILMGDLTLQVLMARVKYWMIPESIPSYKDPEAQSRYYEVHYNTNSSNDKTSEFIKYSKDISEWISHES